MSIIIPANSASAAGGYQVDNSCRFDDGSSAYMHRTPNAGNRRTMTLSVWLKGSSLADGSNNVLGQYNSSNANNAMLLVIEDNGKIMVWNYTTSAYTMDIRTNRLLRDNSAWYHIVVAVDTTQSTASNRVKVYVNGVQETSLSNETYPSQNLELFLNQGVAQNIGTQRYGSTVGSPFDGYMAEFCFIDGTQNAVTDFGEFDEDSGIWKPIDVSGLTFGTNGYYLDFEDSSALGNDANGSNNFTVNNLTAIDQSTDTCTNNFATWNSLASANQNSGNNVTFSEGNLKAVGTSGGEGTLLSTIAVNSGKWYAEFKMIDVADGNFSQIALLDEEGAVKTNGGTGATISVGNVTVKPNGDLFVNETRSAGWGPTFTDNDIIQIAIDLDNGAFYFGKNGTYSNSGNPESGASKTGAAYAFTVSSKLWFFAGGLNGTGSAVSANFGSPAFAISSSNADGNSIGNFEYSVPSGYFALCTSNLATEG